MCNWVCNSSKVLDSIKSDVLCRPREIIFDESFSEKVLGMRWEPSKDWFIFRINFNKVNPDIQNKSRRPTKREVLKLVMSIFDPLGFLCYFTVKGKLLLQDIWRRKTEWDEVIDESLGIKWDNWLTELPLVESVTIPRCYSPLLFHARSIEIHTFCDASDRAYAAVVYLRVEGVEGVTVSFVAAKTKVAPLKQISVPRLELQAAVIGVRLATAVRQALKLDLCKCVFWCDSKTVLSWIRNYERRYKMFVAHRLAEIIETSKVSEWRWVPGRENVANWGTKEGREVQSRWLQGPEFLICAENDWPTEDHVEDSEDKSEVEIISYVVTPSINLPLPDGNRFSSWLKLVRATAWVLKFICICLKDPVIKSAGTIGPTEIAEAEKLWWLDNQSKHFASEIHLVSQDKQLPKRSKLYRLTPFIDRDGVMRVRGRINEMKGVGEDLKHPVLLSSKHRYVTLLIDYWHRRAAHQGHELRQRYWILGLRRAVRSSWSRCAYCAQLRAQPFQQPMGQLPSARLNFQSSPFSGTGVDYFGPLWVTIRRRKESRYGVIFTCLTTRAVHIEVVNDLTTDKTLLAIRRMTNRRGTPKEPPKMPPISREPTKS